MKCKLKLGDIVQVIAGKDIGRTGRILSIDRSKMKVIVEGLNLQTKHQKSNRQNQTGGISRREAPLHISNVMYLTREEQSSDNPRPTRLGFKTDDVQVKFKKLRVARSTKEVVD